MSFLAHYYSCPWPQTQPLLISLTTQPMSYDKSILLVTYIRNLVLNVLIRGILIDSTNAYRNLAQRILT